MTGVKLNREAKRKKLRVLQWFHDNFEALEPELERIEIEDFDGNLMTGIG
jgi:hypothetical protein